MATNMSKCLCGGAALFLVLGMSLLFPGGVGAQNKKRGLELERDPGLPNQIANQVVYISPGGWTLRLDRSKAQVTARYDTHPGPVPEFYLGDITGKYQGKTFTGKFVDLMDRKNKSTSRSGTVTWTENAKGGLQSTWTFNNGKRLQIAFFKE